MRVNYVKNVAIDGQVLLQIHQWQYHQIIHGILVASFSDSNGQGHQIVRSNLAADVVLSNQGGVLSLNCMVTTI